MSDEQLQALGLPRREFLKRAAIFAAPVIVSFGFSGTAEAAGGPCPNLGFANQQATTLGQAVILVYLREQQNLVEQSFARRLRGKLLDAEGKILDGDTKGSCRRLAEVARELTQFADRRIDGGVAATVGAQVKNVQNSIGCANC